jgi:hypothetical protein
MRHTEAVPSRPALSVVLGCPGPATGLRWTVRALAEQTVADRLELVLVTSEPDGVDQLGDALRAFARIEVVVRSPIGSAAAINAAGVRAASAAVVAFGEEHAFPEPGWAEALLDRHAEGWTAVAPAVRNANPATIVSWCDFLTGYGPWMAPARGGEREMLPGHNTSYRRDALLALGERLEEGLAVEAVIQGALPSAATGRLCVEPRAITHHVNFALRRSYLRAAYLNGRAFAAARCCGWSASRRLAYALASALIPAIRLVRILHMLDAPHRAEIPLGRVLPALAVGLTVDAAGQAIGSLRGVGHATEAATAQLEFERWRHVPPADRRALAASYGS